MTKTKNKRFARQRLITSLALVELALIGLSCPLEAQAQLAVASNGLANYTAQIQVPPGVRGAQPALTLHYGGTPTDTPAGAGWTIGGTSVITRCSGTHAIDGATKAPAAVLNIATDKLCLNGERLIPTDANGGSAVTGVGTPDASGLGIGATQEFRTENDSYSRIRAYGMADPTNVAGGPAYFKIWTKDGHVLEFGSGPSGNTSALIRPVYAAGTVQYAQAWALARNSDLYGNYIDFIYSQRDVAFGTTTANGSNGHEWRLSEVQYSGNKVVFSYSDRSTTTTPSSWRESYLAGSKQLTASLLNSVTTYVNSPNTTQAGPASTAVAVKTYNLTHTTSPYTGRARLTQFQECAGGASSTNCMPAVTFKYDYGSTITSGYTAQSGFSLANSPLFTSHSDVLIADFDNDGKSDVLAMDAGGTNTLYRSTGNGTFAAVSASTFNLANELLWTADGCVQTFVVDVNNDGLPDLLRAVIPSGQPESNPGIATCSTPSTVTNTIFINNGNGSFTAKALPSTMGLARRKWGWYSVQIPGNSQPTNIYMPGSNFYVVDVDGDGYPDIVTTYLPAAGQVGNSVANACGGNVCTHYFHNDGTGGFSEQATNMSTTSLYSDPYLTGYTALAPVQDIDGDGHPDVYLQEVAASPAIPVVNGFRTRGDGTGNMDILSLGAYTGTSSATGTFIDYNGSGHPSRLVVADTATDNRLYAAGSSTSGQFNVSNTNVNTTPFALTAKSQHGYLINDFNGDGRQDILKWGDNPADDTFFISNGDGTFYASPTQLNIQLGKSDGSIKTLTGDFLGDGSLQLMTLVRGGGNTFYFTASQWPLDYLTSVTASTGETTYIQTTPLTAGTTTNGVPVYQSDYGLSQYHATSTTIDYAPPMLVTYELDEPNGTGSGPAKVTNYTYAGLKLDTQGRFLGFRQVRKQTTAPDGSKQVNETNYMQQVPYIGEVASTKRYAASLLMANTAPSLATETTVYCDGEASASATSAALSSGVHCAPVGTINHPYRLQIAATGQDLDGSTLPSTTTVQSVRSTGDPVTVTTTVTLTGSASDTYVKTLTNTYDSTSDSTDCPAIDNCHWILGKPTQSTVRGQVPSSIWTTTAGTVNPNAAATSGSINPQKVTMTPTLAFGTVTVGSTTTLPVKIDSDGSQGLTFTSTTISGAGFSIGTSTCGTSLTTGSGCTIAVTYAPTVTSVASGTLTVVTGAGTFTTTLSGTSVAAPTISSVTFNTGNTTVGNSNTFNWTINNSTTFTAVCTGAGTLNYSGQGFTYAGVPVTTTLSAPVPTSSVGTATCTLTAYNAAGASVAQSNTFNVVVAPAVASVNVSATTVDSGKSFILGWTTNHATSVAVSCPSPAAFTYSGSNVNNSGSSVATTGTGSVTCAVTAYNAAGTTSSGSSTVQVVAGPSVTGVTFGAANVTTGSNNTLSWATTNAVSVNVSCTGGSTYSYSGTNVNSSNVTVPTSAAGTATCSVTATDATGGTATSSNTFQVVAAPSVTSNAFNAANATVGTADTLSVTVANTATYTLSCTGGSTYSTSGVGVSSNGVLQPTSVSAPITASTTGTTTCTTTVKNAAGTAVTSSASFQAVSAPTVSSVTFGAATVTSGNNNTVNWATTGATSVAVSCTGTGAYTYSGTTVNYTGANVTTSATGTATCTVIATNAAGTTATSSGTFQVIAVPTVSSVAFSAANVTSGNNDTITWATTGASSVSASCTGAGTYSYSGTTVNNTAGSTVTTSGAGTATCTVTATNAAGSTATRTNTFQVLAAPTVTSVSFGAANVTTGSSNTVNWATTGAASVTVSCTGTGAYSYSGATVNYTGAGVTTSSTGTATCSVVATNAAGATASGSNTFQVVAAPAVTSFTANPANVTAGYNAALSWATTNATNVAVSCSAPGSYTYSGTTVNYTNAAVTTSGAGTSTCSISAYNAAGTAATSTVSFNAVASPNVTSMTLTPATVTVGSNASLSWGTTSAATVNVSCGAPASYSYSGSTVNYSGAVVTTSAVGQTTCGVTATNAAGQQSATNSLPLNIVAAPTVSSVSFGAANVTSGSANTVNWATTGATSVVVSCTGAGAYSYSGTTVNNTGASVSTSSTGTATCTVTATNAAGSTATSSNTFNVVAAPSVTGASFSAANDTVGNADTLNVTVNNSATWAVSCTGAASYSTSGQGLSSGGVLQPTTLSVPVSPSTTGTVTCVTTGTNPAGTAATSSTTFQAIAAPSVSSVSFGATYVTTGNSNTVNWATSGATSVAVSCTGTGSYSYSGGTVNYSGAGVSTSSTGTATCSVVATNAAGSTASGSGTFQVVAAPSVTSASFSPTSVAAGSASTFTWTTANAGSASVSCSGAGATATASGTNYNVSVATTSQGTATCVVTAVNAAGTTATGSANLSVTAPVPVPFNASSYYTFTNPNSFPVTLTAVGAVGTGTSFSAGGSTCNTTSAVAAGGSCQVSFSVSKPSCGGNSGHAYVTDAGGSVSGATLTAASGKICQ